MPELIAKLRFILFETPEEINQIFRAYAKISSHFRIPSSDYLCLRPNLKVLETPSWRDYPCGFAQSEQLNMGVNSAFFFAQALTRINRKS
ncbi:MAG: hypothetical protein B1H12_07040 [Desulfobacteraceae bacterium 4484_190.2]|nr:MAG: hypothetical protein B1H12_07040 [Desulfobacteraceae bacterium 4484_190.2]